LLVNATDVTIVLFRIFRASRNSDIIDIRYLSSNQLY